MYVLRTLALVLSHHSPVPLSLIPSVPLSYCLLFNVCSSPESLYVCSCCHRPLCHTQRVWVHSSFGSIHKIHWCVNQALPPAPGIPRDQPSASDSRDIDQKLVRQDEELGLDRGGWAGVCFVTNEWICELAFLNLILSTFTHYLHSNHFPIASLLQQASYLWQYVVTREKIGIFLRLLIQLIDDQKCLFWLHTNT